MKTHTTYVTPVIFAALVCGAMLATPANAVVPRFISTLDTFLGEGGPDACDDFCRHCEYLANQCLLLTSYSCGAGNGGCVCTYSGLCL